MERHHLEYQRGRRQVQGYLFVVRKGDHRAVRSGAWPSCLLQRLHSKDKVRGDKADEGNARQRSHASVVCCACESRHRIRSKQFCSAFQRSGCCSVRSYPCASQGSDCAYLHASAERRSACCSGPVSAFPMEASCRKGSSDRSPCNARIFFCLRRTKACDSPSRDRGCSSRSSCSGRTSCASSCGHPCREA